MNELAPYLLLICCLTLTAIWNREKNKMIQYLNGEIISLTNKNFHLSKELERKNQIEGNETKYNVRIIERDKDVK